MRLHLRGYDGINVNWPIQEKNSADLQGAGVGQRIHPFPEPGSVTRAMRLASCRLPAAALASN